MKNNYPIFILNFVFLLFLSSCEKGDSIDTLIKTEFFFSGKINNVDKSFNEGYDNYQVTGGADYTSDEFEYFPNIGRVAFGFDTHPFKAGDEIISIHTIDVYSKEDLLNQFPVRELTILEKEKFNVEYHIVKSDSVFDLETYIGVFDKNTTLIINSVEEREGEFWDKLIVNLSFDCILKDLQGHDYGKIINGEMNVFILVRKE